VRELAPEIKIVVGGAPINTYGAQFVEQGLTDFAIRSEGDIALPELLRGNIDYPGILHHGRLVSEPVQILDLNVLPLPDYTDFNFDDYTPGDPAGFIHQPEKADTLGAPGGHHGFARLRAALQLL
jgi:hypothetical protein